MLFWMMVSAQITNRPLENDPFPAALRIRPASKEINRQIRLKRALIDDITDVRRRLASRAFVTGVADFTRIKSVPHATEDWETGYWAHLFGLSCAILKAPYPSQPLPYPMTPGP